MENLIKNMSIAELIELKMLINKKLKSTKVIVRKNKNNSKSKKKSKENIKEESFFKKWDKVIKNIKFNDE